MLSEAVTAAIDAREESDPRDVGLVALAQHYAALIDDAAPSAPLGNAIEKVCAFIPDEPRVRVAWQKIVDALGAASAASDFGPKLLAALDALDLSPRARKVVAKTEKGTEKEDVKPRINTLDELRERRGTRARRAAAVDTTATGPDT